MPTHDQHGYFMAICDCKEHTITRLYERDAATPAGTIDESSAYVLNPHTPHILTHETPDNARYIYRSRKHR